MHANTEKPLEHLLIKACVCGRPIGDGQQKTHGDPPFVVSWCLQCGVGAQLTHQTATDIDALYSGPYHAALDRHEGCVPYAARYEHDCSVAEQRLQRYEDEFGEAFTQATLALDVGAANGAFVDTLNNVGVDAWGIDPDPAMAAEKILTGTLTTLPELGGKLFELIAVHDVLEHVVDPAELLAAAVELMAPEGLLIVDVPHCMVPEGAHHFKAEHLWFFTPRSVQVLLNDAGLAITSVYYPIPGKLVVGGVKR